MKKILIVDDEEITRYALSETMKELGYETVEAENGYDGINIARQELPDLIIMDISMPVMNGIDAVKNIRLDPALQHIPIFMSTGEEAAKSKFTKEQGTEVQGFVEKPYKIEQIAKKIKEFLG